MTDPVKFLLVDDIPENLIATAATLRRDGLELLTARSGPDALELLLEHDISLALLDVQMPGMDGFELAELMRGTERTRRIPIIFLTAGARDPVRLFKGYETGAVDFLYKPVDPVVLRSKADVFFELARHRKELAASLRLNEMFVGILGHDLRNPLGAMVTGAQFLDQRHAADELSRRATQRMLASGARMTEMIEQLLDLTRARLGKGLAFLGDRRAIDVGELVSRAADELRPSHPGRSIEIDRDGDAASSGDPARLLQLFSNVIANALQHGDPGVPVRIGVRGDAAATLVTVHNRGAIASDTLPTLFDPFRPRTGRNRSGGLGLGLYISREIARAHGGDVTAASNATDGTTLTIRLPR